MRFCFASPLCTTCLLAGLASAQFTDAEPGTSVSWADLDPTLSADKAETRASTSARSRLRPTPRRPSRVDEPEAPPMKACFAEKSPALVAVGSDTGVLAPTAAVILDDGSLSTFQLIPSC
ncbi:hypothetical protein AURDEDRAFT_166587 [Auricularia subglabra TFB-10046 SS5]|nr:hypothetical protein AURDEDRAFT_166587 [Auricularia subglabra TFB-10046 SS5]